MVTQEEAECPDQKWFEKKRCSYFKSCDTCDFKNLAYEKEIINQRLSEERQALVMLMEEKKKAKNHAQKKEIDKINKEMTDKAIGVMIMQDTLVKDFGLSAFKGVVDFIKAKREIKKWQKQLKL